MADVGLAVAHAEDLAEVALAEALAEADLVDTADISVTDLTVHTVDGVGAGALADTDITEADARA